MPPPTVAINNFAELVALAAQKRDIQIKAALERDVRLVRFEPGVLEYSLGARRRARPGGAARPQIAGLGPASAGWSPCPSSEGAPSLIEQAQAAENEKRIGLQAHPFVRAALDQFPGAVIVAVRGGEAEAAAPAVAAPETPADDVAYIDESEEEDL